jgi:hypothetical protein
MNVHFGSSEKELGLRRHVSVSLVGTGGVGIAESAEFLTPRLVKYTQYNLAVQEPRAQFCITLQTVNESRLHPRGGVQ